MNRLVCRLAGPMAVATALLSSACLDVAQQRAERDATVGRVERDGLRIEVEDGLAAVRELAPGRLELWANAPTLRAELTLPSEAPVEWVLRVRNAMPDAVLRVFDAAGSPVSAEPLETAFGTDRRFLVRAEPGTLHLVLAAPDADADAPFQFLVFADVQDAIDRVQDIFRRMNTETEARFVMMAGDITERGAADELERFQREQLGLKLPIFVTLGNHELGASEVAYHSYFGRGSQSFTFHGARFTTLDSASATIDPKVYDWLDGWLEQGRGHTHFVFAHIAPVEPIGVRNGCFSSRAEANRLIARMGRADVTASFYGHVHSYYTFEHAGVPVFISGGGGAIPERFDGIGRHYLAIDVDPRARTFEKRLVRVD